MPRLKKFNKNENGNLKKKILIGIYAFLIIGIILTGASYAVYQQEAEVTFINARVGNFKANDIELAIKLDGEEVEVPPEKNELYIVTVDCDNATGRWDMNEWAAVVGNINANKVKCEVNFATPAPTLSEVTATAEKTSISLSYRTGGIGANTTCKWGTEEGIYSNTVEEVTNTNCNITGLDIDTTYYYQVCAINGGGEVCKTGSVKTVIGGVEILNIGDYVSMTPTATSYTIPSSLTGYTSDQTINPSELNLWRIIKKNNNGTVEMVSEYVSSKDVDFYGKNGYMNLVGGLNTIAAQYTNEKYVQSTRHMGYKSQVEKCSSFSSTSCPSDTGYKTDVELVNIVYGGVSSCNSNCTGLMALNKSTGNADAYWLASRYVDLNKDYWARTVYPSGSVTNSYMVSGSSERSIGYTIRPIVTLKSTIVIVSGDGQSADTAYTFE